MYETNTELAKRIGLSKPTIWRFRQRYPDFPKPICIEGSSILLWVSQEVDAWFLSRRAEGRGS